jgi:hypothetical protein
MPQPIKIGQIKSNRSRRTAATVVADADRAAWVKQFVKKMAKGTPEEEAFFAERRRLGRGVGTDKNGKLVRASDLLANSEG